MTLKSRLDHLVKFNSVANRIFVDTLSIGVKLFTIGQPINPNLVLFVSDIGKSYSGSPRAIYEHMRESGISNEFEIVWAFNNPNDYRGIGAKTVMFDTPAYFRIARRAKYWVTDVNIERGLRFKRSETRYLNTWHGSTMKTLGRDIHGRIYYDCSSIDWMCVNSSYDEEIFERAFGLDKEKFIHTGLPKNDYLWNNRNSDSLEYKRKLGLPEDKKIVLYGPTWRDSIDGGKTYSIAPPIDLGKWKDCLGNDCVLVFRMHPLTQRAMGFTEDEFCRDFSRYEPLNDLLLASDLLITDYSSMAFDFSILNRPILCFGYDIDTYAIDRGLYLNLEDVFPYGVQRSEDELIELLMKDSTWSTDNNQSLLKCFNEYGGQAAELCVRRLLDNQ